MKPADLARLLEREHPCERCHERMATGIFDRQFVCDVCRRVLEQRLVLRG